MSDQIKYNGKDNPLLEQKFTERLWKNKIFLPPNGYCQWIRNRPSSWRQHAPL